MALFGVATALGMLEIAFRFVPRSHGVGYSLASRLWFKKYWRLNGLGFRDRDYSEAEVRGKRHIIVLGDSLTTGHGIADVENRFSNRLGRALGDSTIVFNAGRNGADTRSEFRTLHEFPYAPDMVVLVYFVNDIERLFPKVAFEPYAGVPPPIRRIFTGSFLMNYLYWSLPQPDTDKYVAALAAAYADPSIFATHLRDLDKFVAYRDQNRVPLVVVLFPNLANLEMSAAVMRDLRRFFETRHVPIVEVEPLVRPLPVAERIINNNDAHPSVRVHALVADALTRQIASLP